MAQIEGYVTAIIRTNQDDQPGIEISVFIPEPHMPGIVDPVFYNTEEEFKKAEIQNKQDREKYSVDTENMYSLCLEDVSIHPHRDLKEVQR